MSILTTRELEFLASLRTRWHQDYLIEVERLLKEEDDHATTDQQPLDKGRHPETHTAALFLQVNVKAAAPASPPSALRGAKRGGNPIYAVK
jgi:hypothetical protein